MTEQWTNPECRQGKHGNCSDQAWDFISDELVACGCLCHEPERDPYEPVCDLCHGDRIVRVYTGRAGQQTQPCPRCVMEGTTR